MSEVLTVNTEYGEVFFNQRVIGKLVIDGLQQFDGNVFLSNQRGKIYLPKKDSEAGANVEVDFLDGKIHIKLYVVIRFGTSISKVTETLMEQFYQDITRVTGISPSSITIVVAGTMSKNTKRRSIEVKKEYEDR